MTDASKEARLEPLAAVIEKWERGEEHNEGAFDPDCETCLILADLRALSRPTDRDEVEVVARAIFDMDNQKHAGSFDCWPLDLKKRYRANARAALSALPSRATVLEEAARVAEDHYGRDDGWHSLLKQAGRNIAKAIRSLSIPKEKDDE